MILSYKLLLININTSLGIMYKKEKNFHWNFSINI